MPVSGTDYPSDSAELRSWFSTDAACLDYLDWLRWPDGFVCPHCSSTSAGKEATGRYRCHDCRKQVSVTAGTIFHKTRTPMTVWFEVIWLVTASKMGVSAAHIHRVLPVSSYQTAWTMMSKLRQIMSAKDSEPLSGQVEVDETFFGGPKPGVRGRGAKGKTLVIGAIEVGGSGWGRARLAVIEDASSASLKSFISSNIAPGSTVITDAWSAYSPSLSGYVHDPQNVSASGLPAHESLPAVHRLFAQVKRTLEGTYQGAGSQEHLQEYLDEFVFRFNRRHAKHRGLVFLRLLERAVASEPTTYQKLVRVPREKRQRPAGVHGPKPQPGSLERVPVDRPWRVARSTDLGDLNG